MREYLSKSLAITMLVIGLVIAGPAGAEEVEDKTNAAIANILFENDADEFVSYSIRSDGWLDVTFASNTPDPIYSKILNKLETNPDIKGVLAGRNGPTCNRF